MAKALVTIRDATMLNEKVIELQRIILAAQSDALAAQSEQFSLLPNQARALTATAGQLSSESALARAGRRLGSRSSGITIRHRAPQSGARRKNKFIPIYLK